MGWPVNGSIVHANKICSCRKPCTLSHVGVKKVRILPSRVSSPGLGRAKSLVLVRALRFPRVVCFSVSGDHVSGILVNLIRVANFLLQPPHEFTPQEWFGAEINRSTHLQKCREPSLTTSPQTLGSSEQTTYNWQLRIRAVGLVRLITRNISSFSETKSISAWHHIQRISSADSSATGISTNSTSQLFKTINTARRKSAAGDRVGEKEN